MVKHSEIMNLREEQISRLKMQKVWDILIQVAAEDFDKFFGLLSELYERKDKP